MLQEKGVDLRAHITGRSVHNKRIEKMLAWAVARMLKHILQAISTYGTWWYSWRWQRNPSSCSSPCVSAKNIVFTWQVSTCHFSYMLTEQNYTPMQLWISGQVLDPKMTLTEQEKTYGIDHVIPDLLVNDDENNLIDLLFTMYQMFSTLPLLRFWSSL